MKNKEHTEDRESVYRAFLKERHQLLGFAITLTKDYQRAEDIMQDAWLQLVKSIDNGRIPDHVPGWSRRVIRNLSIDSWRKHRLEQPSERFAELIELAYGEEDVQPGDVWADRRSALRQCLHESPSHVRKILALRYSDGLTSERIAAKLGRSMEAIKKQFSRLRKSLEGCIRQRLLEQEV